jgi:hypothetical protein
MGNAWAELTETAKAEYAKQAKELSAAYTKEYKSFYDNLTPETIKAMEAASGKKLRYPGGKKAKGQELRDRAGNPGKPLTAFFEFLKAQRETEGKPTEEGKDSAVVAQAKRAAEKWNQLSDAEKQVSVLLRIRSRRGWRSYPSMSSDVLCVGL